MQHTAGIPTDVPVHSVSVGRGSRDHTAGFLDTSDYILFKQIDNYTLMTSRSCSTHESDNTSCTDKSVSTSDLYIHC